MSRSPKSVAHSTATQTHGKFEEDGDRQDIEMQNSLYFWGFAKSDLSTRLLVCDMPTLLTPT